MDDSVLHKYTLDVGLEIHAQLATCSKLFSAASVAFGSSPNTQVDEITLALPGVLPKINQKAIELAVKMGLACNCKIEPFSFFARKHYFYPDLPKGYQVTQHTQPICTGGKIDIIRKDGTTFTVQLNRMHIEEDAGKSIHDVEANFSCIDLNRAGTALIEIVTEPCIHSAEDAGLYYNEIRKIVKWLGVSDANMEEGSLRCDANISIRLANSTTLGNKVEVKNINSINFLKKAIEFEMFRLIELTEKNQPIIQETRGYDAQTNTTYSLREKEAANDYRYFPDPDLPPVYITADLLLSIQQSMPELPQALKKRLIQEFNCTEYDANWLVEEKEQAAYFLEAASLHPNFKAIINWMMGPLKQKCNELNCSFDTITIQPKKLIEIIQLVDSNMINFSAASGKLLNALFENPSANVHQLATQLELIQVSDEHVLEDWVNQVLQQMPDKVAAYKKGKKGLIGLFVGEIKKLSKGKADPIKVTKLLEEKLN